MCKRRRRLTLKMADLFDSLNSLVVLCMLVGNDAMTMAGSHIYLKIAVQIQQCAV